MGRITQIGPLGVISIDAQAEESCHGGPWDHMLMLIEHGRRSRAASTARRSRRTHRAFRARLATR